MKDKVENNMSGIFDQLPDIAPLEGLRDIAESGFQGALSSTPTGAEDVLGSLPANLTSLLDSVPGDAAGLVQPLTTLLGDVQSAVGVDLVQPVTTIADGLTQIHSTVVNSALGEVVLAAGETRELKDILLEQLPTLSAQYLEQLTAVRDGMLSEQRVQTVIDFFNAISTFTVDVPTEPGQLVDFLARGFVGVPISLLETPSALATPLLDQLEGMAAVVANTDVELQLNTLAGHLSGAAEIVGALDLNAEASYQAAIDILTAAQTTLTSISGGLQGAFDGVNNGLDKIDLSQFEVDFEAAFASIPEVDVASLDDVRSMLLEPFQQINQLVANPQAFIERLQVLLESLTVGLQESDLGAWQVAILGFFEDVRGFVEQLDLVSIRAQVEGAFDTINQKIADIGGDVKQTILDALNPAFDAVENGIDAIDLSAITTFIEDVFGQLDTALDQVSIADLQAQLDSTFATLETVIADLVTQTTSIADQIDQIVSGVGDIQFDPVTEQVIAEIGETTEKLRQIDPDSLSPIQQTALAAAVGILQALDFEETIINFLTDRCAEVVALPQEPLQLVAERLDSLLDAVTAFDAEVIVVPLSDAYAQITAPINELDADTLLEPLNDILAQVKDAFDALSPEQLRAPLDALYEPLPAALDALSPAALLQPVVEVFDQFEEALNKVDLSALLEELENVQGDLFAQAKVQLIDHVQGLGLPAALTDLLVTLTPVLDLMSPAFFVDPVNKLLEVLDKILDELRPGDMFIPLQGLYDELLALLSQVSDELLAGEFEQVRYALVTGLDRIDPAILAGSINGLSLEVSAFLSPMDPEALVASLNAPYQSLSVAFDSLDETSVPAELQTLYDQLEGLVAALNPESALTTLQSNFTAVQSRLEELGTVSLEGLVGSFASLRQQIDALIPDFLREPVTAETLTAALDAERPDALAADLNDAFEELKTKYAALKPQLLEELQGFADENQNLLLVLNLQGLTSQFQEIYDAIKAQVLALNPNGIIEDLQGTFDTVKAQVEALNPTFLVDELTETFNRIKGKLDEFGLDAIEIGLTTSLQNIKDKLAVLDPREILSQAGLFDRFSELQEALNSVSVVAIVAELGEALQKLCDELREELDKVQSSFDTMISAIPAQINVGISL
jgi:hypothetical protein